MRTFDEILSQRVYPAGEAVSLPHRKSCRINCSLLEVRFELRRHLSVCNIGVMPAKSTAGRNGRVKNTWTMCVLAKCRFAGKLTAGGLRESELLSALIRGVEKWTVQGGERKTLFWLQSNRSMGSLTLAWTRIKIGFLWLRRSYAMFTRFFCRLVLPRSSKAALQQAWSPSEYGNSACDPVQNPC